MANSATQDDAVTNGKADLAAVGGGGVTGPGSRTAVVETPTSGTAFQPAGGRSCDLYIAITTAAALKVEMGPTTGVATTLMPSQSAALGMLHVEVPGGFYVKLTGTTTNYVVTSVRK